jgi:hypothetical protein
MRNHRLDPMTRGAKMNEQMRALKQLWENDDDRFEFFGAPPRSFKKSS